VITLEEAIKKCNNELAFAIHMEDCAPNAGLQVIYSNKAEWLCQVLYAARMYSEYTKERRNEPFYFR
jgi:hypothetical protein